HRGRQRLALLRERPEPDRELLDHRLRLDCNRARAQRDQLGRRIDDGAADARLRAEPTRIANGDGPAREAELGEPGLRETRGRGAVEAAPAEAAAVAVQSVLQPAQ